MTVTSTHLVAKEMKLNKDDEDKFYELALDYRSAIVVTNEYKDMIEFINELISKSCEEPARLSWEI